MIGRLERVPLREVWLHEALDFTTWLVENPDVLQNALGLELGNLQREQAAGKFSVDILAEDRDGHVVVIENQLERSNHDHLGKLITYMAMMEAKVAVWIVSEPRPEHVSAVSWLNESGLCDFYLVKLEAARVITREDQSIKKSDAAPLLTLITGPSDEQLEIGEAKKEQAARYGERYEFWKRLLERSKSRTRLFSTVSPSKTNWISTGSGKGGISFNYVAWQRAGAVEVYIGTGDPDENRRIFNALHAQQTAIEQEFGDRLEWEPLEERMGCRIRYRTNLGGYRTPEAMDEAQDAMIDAMIRLEAAIRPRLSADLIDGGEVTPERVLAG